MHPAGGGEDALDTTSPAGTSSSTLGTATRAHRHTARIARCRAASLPPQPSSPAPSVATEAYSEELEEEEEPPIDGANAPSLVMSALEWSTGTYSSSE